MKYRKEATKRRIAYAALFLLPILLSLTALFSLSLSAAVPTPPVSPGLRILAGEFDMAMAGLRGSAISFDAEDFARAVNLSQVTSVTVTKVPAVADGELRVGNLVLTGGQRLGKEGLSELTFKPRSSDLSTSSFRFTVNDSPVELTCNLYLLDEINHCPSLSMVPKTSLNVSTHQNVTLYGSLPCYDPEGDETRIEIVSYPKSGLLILTDRTSGDYTYTPDASRSGRDSFTYVARDRYGNYSAAATVLLTVTKPETAVVYEDLKDGPLHNAALTMTEEGIMTGVAVGGGTYFYPNGSVSRGEFVVMAMEALGMREVNGDGSCVFEDCGELSEKTRSYLSAAYELGYVQGELGADGGLSFAPSRAVTRAEAAVIVGRMIQASTPTITPVFTDASEIPAWAAPSLYSLHSLGILSARGDQLSPHDALSRGETAQMLSALMVHTDAN